MPPCVMTEMVRVNVHSLTVPLIPRQEGRTFGRVRQVAAGDKKGRRWLASALALRGCRRLLSQRFLNAFGDQHGVDPVNVSVAGPDVADGDRCRGPVSRSAVGVPAFGVLVGGLLSGPWC